MTTYEVREQTSTTNPADRGVLVAMYVTYREAFRRWQELSASGRNVFISRVQVSK